MRIDRLELQNFRGFEHLVLELHPRLTLLIGNNGSGKSNALEGLAVGLSGWLLGLSDMWRHARRFQRGDVRQALRKSTEVPSLEPRFPVAVTAIGCIDDEQVEWRRWVAGLEETFYVDNGQHELAEVSHGVNGIQDVARKYQNRLSGSEKVELPVLAQYGTNRLRSAVVELGGQAGDRSQKLGSRLRGYEGGLTSAASYERFEAWMAWRTEASLQRLAELIKAGGPPKEVPRAPELEAMEQAVLGCVGGAKRFFYDVNHQELRLELDTGELVPFSQLSDGYRNLVAMVADITWRASQLNPHHGANAARDATGVVLIDELELHLHPAWQRRVIDDLLRTFPNLQFVATTHSPQVIASARPEHLWLLHDGKAMRPGPIHGKDSNAILRDIMGVGERPDWMRERLAELARLIDDGALDDAKALLAKVEDDLGQDDPTVTGLQWELHDLEVHGAPDPQEEGA
ncbi:AAA family ATPase [Paraliomyxa miuraensis]|uniref:AAA family ATPase n=1 Tax=Paraliomyxa miuraensis TaxID=376150 RepID=UPI00224CB3B8|nr:AAA family ATPase [Paraliomyxa miuraensis]MCX4239896.1 AAA family ATPase [Paraliomyxa miuraensis]